MMREGSAAHPPLPPPALPEFEGLVRADEARVGLSRSAGEAQQASFSCLEKDLVIFIEGSWKGPAGLSLLCQTEAWRGKEGCGPKQKRLCSEFGSPV